MGGDGLPWPPATSLPVQQAGGLRLAGLRCLRAWAVAGLELLTVYVFGNQYWWTTTSQLVLQERQCVVSGFFAAAKLGGTFWLLELTRIVPCAGMQWSQWQFEAC